jgi:hypothetical protein
MRLWFCGSLGTYAGRGCSPRTWGISVYSSLTIPFLAYVFDLKQNPQEKAALINSLCDEVISQYASLGLKIAEDKTLTSSHLHCPKSFQQKFMLAQITPNRASFKILYRAKIPYFASVKNLCCI